MKVMMTKADSKSFLLTDIYKGSKVVTAQKRSKNCFVFFPCLQHDEELILSVQKSICRKWLHAGICRVFYQ